MPFLRIWQKISVTDLDTDDESSASISVKVEITGSVMNVLSPYVSDAAFELLSHASVPNYRQIFMAVEFSYDSKHR
jgi:hypothetical protein